MSGPPRLAPWVHEQLVVCGGGPKDGLWFTRTDWFTAVEAAENMLAKGQPRSAYLDYVTAGGPEVVHPHEPAAAGVALRYSPPAAQQARRAARRRPERDQPAAIPAPRPAPDTTADTSAGAPADTEAPAGTSPDERRRAKAEAIARYTWRMGVTSGSALTALLQELPWSSRRRDDRTCLRFARAAYQHAGADLQPPHGRGSQTWALAAQLLDHMAEFAARQPNDPRVPAVDLAHERASWAEAAITHVVTDVVDQLEADVEASFAELPDNAR